MTEQQNKVSTVKVPVAVELALDKSRQVKEKVQAVADDLGTTNEHFEQKIAAGHTMVPLLAVLADNTQVQGTVQECATDLYDLNELLLRGVNELHHSDVALADSQTALVDSQAALTTATAGEARQRHKAQHDGLTGLPNHELFNDRLTHAIALAERHVWTLAILFIDLDHFKQVNDSYGHAAGDAVLHEVAIRLQQRCRSEDTVCRYGGDEFVFLIMDPQGRENVETIVNAMLKSISVAIEFGALSLGIKASIGISLYPEDGSDCGQLVRSADAAMYQAKKQKLGASFFSAPSST